MSTGRIKWTSPRGPNAAAPMRPDERVRLVSDDGLRSATNRYVKRPLPERRFDIVEAWTLRERRGGRAVIVSTGMTKEAALAWVANITKL